METVESLEVGVVISFELNVERPLNVNSSVRACKGVLLMSLSESLNEPALESKYSSDSFVSMDTSDVLFCFVLFLFYFVLKLSILNCK